MMNRTQIFNHWHYFHLAMGRAGQFNIDESDTATFLFTGYNSYEFNYIDLHQLDYNLLDDWKSKSIPFSVFSSNMDVYAFDGFITAQGFSFAAKVYGQYCDITALCTNAINTDIVIDIITTEKELEIFDYISSICFNHEIGFAFNFLKSGLYLDECTMFLAYIGDIPCATGMIMWQDNVPGLYWDCVLPKYRGKGIGTSLVLHRINYIKSSQRNISHIVAQNFPSSTRYYQKLGFMQVEPEVNFYIFNP